MAKFMHGWVRNEQEGIVDTSVSDMMDLIYVRADLWSFVGDQ